MKQLSLCILFISLSGAVFGANDATNIPAMNFLDQTFEDGIAHLENKDYPAAIEIFTKIITQSPTYIRAHLSRGIAFYYEGKLDAAMADFDQTLKLDPGYAYGHLFKGMTYFQLDNLDKALSHFYEAILYDPQIPLAYYNRGVALYRKGDYRGALDDLERAKELGFDVESDLIDEIEMAQTISQLELEGKTLPMKENSGDETPETAAKFKI